MRLLLGRKSAIAAIVALMAVVAGFAQNPPSTKPDQSQSPAGQTTTEPTAEPEPTERPRGKVLFQRSLDGTGNIVSTTRADAKASSNAVVPPVVSDVERAAIAVTGLDLDVRLNTEAQQIAVRGQVTVRNAGTVPLTRIPLQISSSLNWERIRVEGQDVRFPVATVESDSDHTLQLHEAVAQLDEPLAAGDSIQMDVLYSGRIESQAPRLTSLVSGGEPAGNC
jgi:hypothetical protein